jgi:hypothetical protein
MQLNKLLILLGAGLFCPGASAHPYINGWTESTFNSGVKGCVASAVPKQMQFMLDSGQVRKGATPTQKK